MEISVEGALLPALNDALSQPEIEVNIIKTVTYGLFPHVIRHENRHCFCYCEIFGASENNRLCHRFYSACLARIESYVNST